jgi:hypothetical protein
VNIELTGGGQNVTFDVPYIRVPETFIYSVMEAGDGYFSLCNGPTVGSSPNYCWYNLRKDVSSSGNHLQVTIEAEDWTDAILLAWIDHSAWMGIGGEDRYGMEFEMRLGGYWDMFAPSFHGVTEWDIGSFLQINAKDLPRAVSYLTNGVDEKLRVSAEFTLKGNDESDTLEKTAGVAESYPDLMGYFITDFVLVLNDIDIDYSGGTTYFTSDVRWEIWGSDEKTADLNLDGIVNFIDYSIFSSAWHSEPGQENWNPLCDVNLPEDNQINIYDLQEFCSAWLLGCSCP